MTDEEKKAIKDCDTIFICLEDMMSEESANDYRKSYLTLTNLIEKQSKEIEELKQKEKEAYKFGYRNGCNDTSKFNNKTFIRIDKIKAKVEDILNSENSEAIEKLIEWQSLLEDKE